MNYLGNKEYVFKFRKRFVELTCSTAQGAALSLHNRLAQLSQASHQQHHIACHDGLERRTEK